MYIRHEFEIKPQINADKLYHVQEITYDVETGTAERLYKDLEIFY